VCEGLAAAHAEGVIHRDFKSSNVMLVRRSVTEDGATSESTRVAITDFGIARAVHLSAAEEAAVEERLTGRAGILGTPEYMAPEQVTGGEVTAATAHRWPSLASPPERLKPDLAWLPVALSELLGYELRAAESSLRVHQDLGHDASGLPEATARLGEQLRTRLRASITQQEEAALAASRIRKPEAAKPYAEAVIASRKDDYFKTQALLQAAIANDSTFLLAQLRAAETWGDQGYGKKAPGGRPGHPCTSRLAHTVAGDGPRRAEPLVGR